MNAQILGCKAIADLGVSMLAAGIGNIHGNIQKLGRIKLRDFRCYSAAYRRDAISTSRRNRYSGDMIKKAIDLGVARSM